MTGVVLDMDLIGRFFDYNVQHLTWGALHIAVDDTNIDDGDVEYCIRSAAESGDVEGEALARIFLAMNMRQRALLARNAYPDTRSWYWPQCPGWMRFDPKPCPAPGPVPQSLADGKLETDTLLLLRELHDMDEHGSCDQCGDPFGAEESWPCPTALLLFTQEEVDEVYAERHEMSIAVWQEQEKEWQERLGRRPQTWSEAFPQTHKEWRRPLPAAKEQS